MPPQLNLTTLFQPLADASDSDLYLFRGPIEPIGADTFIGLLRDHEDRRPNCTLILTTLGGIPDAGYRMVRAIKRYYRQFNLLVYGECKSTGTLMALGADQIAMGDYAELGPLDIQLTKDDEMLTTSGLAYNQSLLSIGEELTQQFYNNFVTLKRRGGLNLTTRTAAEVACKLAVGLLSPISSQLDPVKLGEVYRAIAIAGDYGRRLTPNSNLVSHLITGYSSHGFVIDLEEARAVFGQSVVRGLNEPERDVERNLLPELRHEMDLLVQDLTRLYLQGDPVDDDADDDDDENPTSDTSPAPIPHDTPEQQAAAEEA